MLDKTDDWAKCGRGAVLYIIPNVLTILRLLMVPVIVWLMIEHQMMTAFVLFVIAGITDGLDGFLAKRFGWSTELGAWLDPAADKALLVSIYVTLGVFGMIPNWLVILVVSRDLLIVGGVLLSMMMENPVRMKPLLISKSNTVGQILLAAMVLADLGFQLRLGNIVDILILIVAALTILSALAYLHGWFKHMLPNQ
jgi:cardiolipin synthase